MRRKLHLLILAGAVLAIAGCITRLEPGGAYAPLAITNATTGVITPAPVPDMAFYTIDATYALTWAAMDGAFAFEKANRLALWRLSPNIKHSLDQIRPQAWAINVQYHKARDAYKAVPVPANLAALEQSLARTRQLLAAITAVLPQQK